MSTYESVLRQAEKYSGTIISDITNLLDEKSIKYECTASTIVIPDSDKKKISSLIETLCTEKNILYYTVDICQVKKNVYIRKKLK